MKRLTMPLAFMAVISMGMAAQAGPFGVFARQPVRNTAHVAQDAVQGAVSGATGGIAQAKAETQARQGVMRHVAGSFFTLNERAISFFMMSPSGITQSSIISWVGRALVCKSDASGTSKPRQNW